MASFLAFFKQGGHNNGEEVFWMDATVRISPVFNNTVTRHPVDNRSTISDHVVNENITIEINGQVTNSPYIDMPGNVIPQEGIRVQQAYDWLVALRNSRQPITIVAELDTYDNCVLKSLSLPQDHKSSEALDISVVFEQIRVVSIERGDTFLTGDLSVDALPAVNKGNKRSIFTERLGGAVFDNPEQFEGVVNR